MQKGAHVRETVLITGASSGIGFELAKLYANSGCNLILVARTASKLENLKNEVTRDHNVRVELVVADLAEVDAAEKLVDEINARKLTVDVLVNNAGFGQLGQFAGIAVQRQLDMIRLNVVTLMHLTRLLLPGMLERKRGGILNVASTAAFQSGPNMAVYYATKAFVLSFSEAIHEELDGTGVKVVCLAPGPTETGFGDDSGINKTRIFTANAMNAAQVAQAGFDALKSNRAIVIPGWKNRAGALLTRIVPRSVVRKIVKKLQTV